MNDPNQEFAVNILKHPIHIVEITILSGYPYLGRRCLANQWEDTFRYLNTSITISWTTDFRRSFHSDINVFAIFHLDSNLNACSVVFLCSLMTSGTYSLFTLDRRKDMQYGVTISNVKRSCILVEFICNH